MKTHFKNIFIIGALSLLMTLISCEKWLDVVPQTQIEADRVFEKESGFQDALTGVYVKMTSESLYGRELTFGMIDGLAGQFNSLASSNQYYSTLNYDYDEANFIGKSESLFSESYNAIANLNTLIENIEEKGAGLFSGVNYYTIRGEAYALRAFLHFDLVRLYGSSLASEGENELAIPYIDAVGTVPEERLTTKAFLDKVIADLLTAEQSLEGYDPIIPQYSENATTYLRDRTFKLNYYAVKALQARVYLYAGDKEKALAAATVVVDSEVFDWTPASEIATSSASSRNKLFTQELIFCLNVTDMSTITSPFYDIGVSGSLLAKSPSQYDQLFTETDDYRYQYLTEYVPSLYRHYSTKLVQGESSYTAYANRMPMIRKSELYYIAAECLAESDLDGALAYLNEVRLHRNLSDAPVSSVEELNSAVKLEYRKEFIGEGQLFFYYKRLNSTQISDVSVTMNDDTYVLPLPDREISYGQ